MRVVLVGREPDRDRLRPALLEAGIDVVAEAPTLAAARERQDAASSDEARTTADAFVLARSESPVLADDPDVIDEPLTPRELQVLALLAEGLPNKTIAQQLDISDQTVKFHVAAILAKLGAQNRTEAVRRAMRKGLIVI